MTCSLNYSRKNKCLKVQTFWGKVWYLSDKQVDHYNRQFLDPVAFGEAGVEVPAHRGEPGQGAGQKAGRAALRKRKLGLREIVIWGPGGCDCD